MRLSNWQSKLLYRVSAEMPLRRKKTAYGNSNVISSNHLEKKICQSNRYTRSNETIQYIREEMFICGLLRMTKRPREKTNTTDEAQESGWCRKLWEGLEGSRRIVIKVLEKNRGSPESSRRILQDPEGLPLKNTEKFKMTERSRRAHKSLRRSRKI